jgi:hypothetical protein
VAASFDGDDPAASEVELAGASLAEVGAIGEDSGMLRRASDARWEITAGAGTVATAAETIAGADEEAAAAVMTKQRKSVDRLGMIPCKTVYFGARAR